MTPTWRSRVPPQQPEKFDLTDWLRVVRRGGAVLLILGLGLVVHSIVRVFEKILFREARPVTPWIVKFICQACLVLIGLRCHIKGNPMRDRGAAVSNHVSWLDIFVLNATQRIYFVSKAEVRTWPGIGWLARAAGTVFIARKRSAAKEQTAVLDRRLALGHRVLFFPEGTSTDGLRVLAFKTPLFAAFFTSERTDWALQPITLIYNSPVDDPRFYGWWGDMSFGGHALKVLAAKRQGDVCVTFHAPIPVRHTSDRKALAQQAETFVRKGLEDAGITAEGW